jgi:hypothetical protein
MNASTRRRRRVVYKTPGRECPHADRGCCPKCRGPHHVTKFPSRDEWKQKLALGEVKTLAKRLPYVNQL